MQHGKSFVRFLLVSLCGFTLNSFFVFVLVTVWGLSPLWALVPMVIFTPPMIFLLSKYFAFRKA